MWYNPPHHALLLHGTWVHNEAPITVQLQLHAPALAYLQDHKACIALVIYFVPNGPHVR